MAAKVPFNYGQSVVDVIVRPERSQALNNSRDANSAPHVEEVVGVLVLSPLHKRKRLKHRKSARAAYRNLPGNPCAGSNVVGQLYPAPVSERQFKTRRNERSQIRFKVPQVASLIRPLDGRNQKIYGHRMDRACSPGLQSPVALIIDLRLESRVP